MYMASSMHMSWGIWKIATIDEWTIELDHTIVVFIMASWHIAVGIGSFIGSVLEKQIRKKFIYVS